MHCGPFILINAFNNLQTLLTIHEKTYLQYFALRYLLTNLQYAIITYLRTSFIVHGITWLQITLLEDLQYNVITYRGKRNKLATN